MIIQLFRNYFLSFTFSFCVVVSVAMMLNFVEEAFFTPVQAQVINLEVEQVTDYLEQGYVGSFHYPTEQSPRPRLPEVYEVSKNLEKPHVQTTSAFLVANQLEEEPDIRVGLYNTDKVVKIRCNQKSRIVKKNGTTVKNVKANKLIKIKYKPEKKRYYLKVGKFFKIKKSYLKVMPENPEEAVCTIVNYDNSPAWNPDLNDNQFRENIEVQYSSNSDTVWVMNELGLEHYIQGIGESGNNNDKAYLKSLLTAARTYATYHYIYPTKHADEPYLLDTTGNDQVYIGYSFEQRAPNVVQAAKDTAGRVITYKNEIVVAPYFSRSDGRTRAWSEVWNGDKAYLISKEDPGCEGMDLWGHGVGMSAEGARYFAETEDWGWKKILKYYYTGIKIKRAYPI